jgi:gamma-glutamyltranspeptidase/glutathione hydrolase
LFAALRLYERFTTAHALDRPSSLALAIHAAFVQREAHHQPELPLHLDEQRLRLVAAQWASAPVPGSGVASEEPGDTTHLTVCDQWGNLVSLTQSIQSLFGAKALHPHLGFFYNNYLCTCPRRGHPNRLRPHCRPRSNVTPTLIESPATGRWVALGAAGSRRIVSSLLQVITSILDTGLTLRDAVHAPRLHALLSGSVWVERPLAEASADRLRERFPTLEVVRRHSYAMGCVQAIAVRPHHASEAVADPRRDGSAAVLARMDGCA